MVGGGEFKSALVQQMMWSGTGTDSKNMMSSLLMPCAEEQEAASTRIRMPPSLSSPSSSSMLLPQQLLQISSDLAPEVNTSLASDLHDGQESNMPESWSQLLLGELVGDHERYSTATALLSKGLEKGPMPHQAAAAYNFYSHYGGEEIQTSSGTNKSQVSQMLLAASSPRSCVTTSLSSNMLDFSNSAVPPAPELRNHHSDNSSESNSNATGSAPKKARVQTSSAHSTLKVRKERLGDRITALHQIVSPFGKTDTASVLQETIGYIRFLLGQIEALSYPYMGHDAGNGNSSMQQQQQITDVEEDHGGGEGEKQQDLRSRGLCLVPVSCTSHLADDGAAASDFWAVAAVPPPPLAGIAAWR